MIQFPETELILTPENRVYHLNLKNEDIADTVILVGDPNRVKEVSKYFDKIEFKTDHREFITHTGTFNKKRITVLSTGIGPDNIDIVINELDAAVNINPSTRTLNPKTRSLDIYRLGTSGSLQGDLGVDELIVSSYGLGIDGLLQFYDGLSAINEKEICENFIQQTEWSSDLPTPYCIAASNKLLKKFGKEFQKGITVTAPGFYGPQGRQIRLKPSVDDLNKSLQEFSFQDLKITNFEMETSAMYGLGKLLDHNCLTICVIIANRVRKEFTTDYAKSIDQLITKCLNKISES